MGKKFVSVAAVMLCACSLGLFACSGSSSAESNSNPSESTSVSGPESAQPANGTATSAESSSVVEDSATSPDLIDSHVDDFTIVNVEREEDNGYGYWEMKVTVQNNTDEEKNFLGFQIDELNADGNIINSYMSYNKNASDAIVEPGQQYTISLTEKSDDGIAGMQSRYCEWGEFGGDKVKCEYSEKYKIMF